MGTALVGVLLLNLVVGPGRKDHPPTVTEPLTIFSSPFVPLERRAFFFPDLTRSQRRCVCQRNVEPCLLVAGLDSAKPANTRRGLTRRVAPSKLFGHSTEQSP